MLIHSRYPANSTHYAHTQRGVTLLMALILLVAMTIAGIVLLRSVDLTNIIAGNLAFKQAATHAADIGVERAFAYLQANSANLHNSDPAKGYFADGSASNRSPASGQSWHDYWEANINNNPRWAWTLDDSDSDRERTGNRISVVIHRMCLYAYKVNEGANCAGSTVASTATGTGEEGGEIPLKAPSSVYYRITVRVDGPRNTRSYVQAMVTL